MEGSEASAMAVPSIMLPFDILTAVFSHLDLTNVFKCHLVCKHWRQAARDDSVLRPLCHAKGYVGRHHRFNDLGKAATSLHAAHARRSDGHYQLAYSLLGLPYKPGATSWEEILKRAHLLAKIKFPPPLDNADFAPGPSALQDVVKAYSNRKKEFESDIWRVKIDPIDNVMLTTSTRGNLIVLDLDNGQELWRGSAKACAHLELEEGWAVYDRDNRDGQGHFEVGRLERVVHGQNHPHRGRLASVGIITCAASPRAFRLVWPQLVVAMVNKIAVYDVRELRVVEQFDMSRKPPSSWPVRYVNMDQDFIFVLAGDRLDMYADESDEESERGGLAIYERGSKGRIVFNGWMGTFNCVASWFVVDRGLGTLTYKGQPLKDCGSLGISNEMVCNTKDEHWRYEHTTWCEAVHPDHVTGSLVLSGRGRLLVIPDYVKAFQEAEGGTSEQPCIQSIGIGAEYIDCGRPATNLAVTDGIAAFVAAAHHMPAWVDLSSLIRSARDPSITPRASMLSLGQNLLYDNTAVIFKASSSLHMDGRRLAVVADFLRQATDGPEPGYNSHSLAVTMDFGSVLQAKIDHPDAPVDKVPNSVDVCFPRRTLSDQRELAAWRTRREGWAQARLIFPNGAQDLWSKWAPHRVAALGEGGQPAERFGRGFLDFGWRRRVSRFNDMDDMDGLLDGAAEDLEMVDAILASIGPL